MTISIVGRSEEGSLRLVSEYPIVEVFNTVSSVGELAQLLGSLFFLPPMRVFLMSSELSCKVVS